jgi:hypothetical protein
MRVHQFTSNVIRKAVSAVATGALAFAMLGSSALAAPPVVREHIASRSAGAGNLVCNGPECTSTSVFVFVNAPDGPSQACLDISRYEMVGTSFILLGWEFGCADLAEGSFSIDTKSLSGAALSTTEVTLQAYECDATGCNPTGATRTAVIGATYTGVGDVITFRSNSKQTFGGCTMYFGGKGSSRNATATLTINGQSVEASGSLFTSTQRVKVLCH